MFPFSVPGDEQWFELTPEIRVQQYGSLTVAEALTLEQLLTPELQALLKESTVESLIHFRSILAAVLLISRYEPATTLKDVAALGLETIIAASDFLLRERDRSVEQRQPKDGEGQKTDWASLWWKLQRHYPHEPRFRAEVFGNCPMQVVEQAIDSLEEERLQQLSAEAMPIAMHGYYSVSLHTTKAVKPEWFNPWQQVLDRQQAKAEIPEQSARLFLDLCAQKQVPAWVVALVDVEKIRRAA